MREAAAALLAQVEGDVRVMARVFGRKGRRAGPSARAAVEVDDLRQVGMLAAWRCADRFDAGRGAQFSTFSAMRIRGAMLDELRRCWGVGRRAARGRGLLVEMDREAVGGDDPVEVVHRRDLAAQVRAAVARLPEVERLVLEAVLEGRSCADAGRERGITNSGACYARKRGLARLRKTFGGRLRVGSNP